MSKERPILFSAAMVRAILAGQKTQTRSVLSPQPSWVESEYTGGHWHLDGYETQRGVRECVSSGPFKPDKYAASEPGAWFAGSGPRYGQPGDRLWVRETWRTGVTLDHLRPKEIEKYQDLHWCASCQWHGQMGRDRASAVYTRGEWVCPRCGGAAQTAGAVPIAYSHGHCLHEESLPLWGSAWGKPRPAPFMVRTFSRITLEVTGVRVERLHDISEADAEQEGLPQMAWGVYTSSDIWPQKPDDIEDTRDPCKAFQWLWSAINGAESWAANPWVWVVEFRKVQP